MFVVKRHGVAFEVGDAELRDAFERRWGATRDVLDSTGVRWELVELPDVVEYESSASRARPNAQRA